jgi:hypothetical protein
MFYFPTFYIPQPQISQNVHAIFWVPTMEFTQVYFLSVSYQIFFYVQHGIASGISEKFIQTKHWIS